MSTHLYTYPSDRKGNLTGDIEIIFEVTDATSLVVKATHEGLIMDAYSVDPDGNDQLVGTVARMDNEWWDYIEGSGG